MERVKIIGTIYITARVLGKDDVKAKEILTEKLDRLKGEPLLNINTTQILNLDFEEHHPHNLALPEDTDEKKLVFRQDYRVFVECEDIFDFLNIVARQRPDYAEITDPDKLAFDIEGLNNLMITMLDTNNALNEQCEKLYKKNFELYEIIKRDLPHLIPKEEKVTTVEK